MLEKDFEDVLHDLLSVEDNSSRETALHEHQNNRNHQQKRNKNFYREEGNGAINELTIAFWNCDGITPLKWKAILLFILRHQIDYMCLIDARVSVKVAKYLKSTLKKHVHAGMKLWCDEPYRSGYKTIGGQLVIVSHRIPNIDVTTEVKFGGLSRLNVTINNVQMRICGVYIPVKADKSPEEAPHTLRSGLIKDGIDHPETTILEMIKQQSSECQYVVVGGDFNTAVDKTDQFRLRDFVRTTTFTFAECREELLRPTWTRNIPGDGSYAGTRIDYILTSGIPRTKQVKIGPVLEFLQDHFTMRVTIKIPQGQTREYQRDGKLTFRKNLNIQQQRKVARFQSKLLHHEWPDGNLEQQLEYITDFSVTVVQQLYRKQSGRDKSGISPQMLSLTIALRAVLRMRQHIRGEAGRPKWNSSNYTNGMNNVLRNWRQSLRTLDKVDENKDPERDNHVYNVRSWDDITWQELPELTQTAYRNLKKLLHGRQRKAMSTQIKEAVATREEHMNAGKLRFVLHPILGIRREQYHLDVIKVNEEEVTDPEAIFNLVRQTFKCWFGNDSDDNMALQPQEEEWDPWIANREVFVGQFHQTMNIPVELLHVVWNALQPKGTAEQRAAMEEQLVVAPTKEEFYNSIKYAGRGKATGLSGLSNEMMQCWPDIIKDKVHSILCEMWKDKQVPAHFKWKYLVAIPKVPDPNLDQLRPLMLVECLRKVWTSCFVRRIGKIWSQDETLEDEQHGSRARKSCDTATVQWLNALETAKEWKSNVFAMSFDIAKAFDTVSRSIQRMAYHRLGIPKEVAKYMTDLDENGPVIVRAPFSTNIVNNIKRSQIQDKDLAFNGWKGLGQGDPGSPQGWSAVADIMLTCLKTQDTRLFYQTHTGRVLENDPYMYVDDLIEAAGDLDALQKIGELFSAVTLVLGLKVAAPKIRAVAAMWGNNTIDEPQVTLYTQGWVPAIINLKTEDKFKYLGQEFDVSLNMSEQMKTMNEQLRQFIAALDRAQASPEAKYKALTLSVYPKLGWRLRYCNGTLKEFQKLDKPVNAFLRRISNCRTSYPTRLLYTSKQDGGLGFSQFSSYIQQRKLAVVDQLLRQHTRSAAAIDSMIARVARTQGHIPIAGEEIVVRHFTDANSTSDKWWATSLVEYLANLGVRIHLTGTSLQDTPHESVLEYLHRRDDSVSPSVQDQLIATGISTRAELLMDGDNRRTLQTLELPQINITPVPETDVIARVHQVWSLGQGDNEKIVEIIGFDATREIVSFIEWHRDKQRPTLEIGGIVWLYKQDNRDYCRGAGSLRTMHANEFRGATRLQLVNLTRETHTSRGTWSKILLKRRRAITFRRIEPIEAINVYDNWLDDANECYTDGSWAESGNIYQWMTGTTTQTSGCAIVKRTQTGQYSALKIEGTLKYASAFDMETMALTAVQIINPSRPLEVYTDSISAMKSAINAKYLQWKSHPRNIMMQTLAGNVSNHFNKVKAHAERQTQDQTKWTLHEKGNVLADQVAGTNSHAFVGRILEVRDTEILHHCAQRQILFLEKDSQPLVESITQLESAQNLNCYLIERDHWREGRIDTMAKWQTKAVPFAIQSSFGAKTIAQRAAANRLLWDKHLNGRHVGLFGMFGFTHGMPLTCCLCNTGQVEDQEHILHECLNSSSMLLRQEMIEEQSRYVQRFADQPEDHQILETVTEFMANYLNVNHSYTNMHSVDNVRQLNNQLNNATISKQTYNRITNIGKIRFHKAQQIRRAHEKAVKETVMEKHKTSETSERIGCVYSSKVYRRLMDAQRAQETVRQRVIAPLIAIATMHAIDETGHLSDLSDEADDSERGRRQQRNRQTSVQRTIHEYFTIERRDLYGDVVDH